MFFLLLWRNIFRGCIWVFMSIRMKELLISVGARCSMIIFAVCLMNSGWVRSVRSRKGVPTITSQICLWFWRKTHNSQWWISGNVRSLLSLPMGPAFGAGEVISQLRSLRQILLVVIPVYIYRYAGAYGLSRGHVSPVVKEKIGVTRSRSKLRPIQGTNLYHSNTSNYLEDRVSNMFGIIPNQKLS